MACDLAALRLGWYPRLEKSGVRRLAGAAGFFKVPPQSPRPFPAGQVPSSALALDEFHHSMLEVIDQFWAGNYREAAELLDRIESSASVERDRLKREKFHLLRARIARARGDYVRARASYDELLDSLHFKLEAKDFL
jgi:hypothetical protein